MSRRGLVVALVLAGAAALGGWYAWRGNPGPAPPDLPLDAMEKPVADAVAAAVRNVRESPRSGPAWGKLGMVLLANGYADQAVVCLAEAERLDPADPRWPYLQVSRVQAEDRARAEALLRRAVDLAHTPERKAAARFRLAQAELEDGRPDAAEPDVWELAAIDPADGRARLCRGLLAVLRQDPAAAREHLSGLTDSPFARKRACSLLAALPGGDPAERRAFHERAAKLPADAAWPDPFVQETDRFDVRRATRLAVVREMIDGGHPTEALDELTDLAARSPHPDVYGTLGLVLMNLRRLDEAEAALGKAVELDPRSPQAQALYATVLIGQGDAQAQQPGGQDLARKRFERALAAADRGLATDANYPVGHLARGRALRALGRTDEALGALRRAVECGPEYPDTHLRLGESLAEAGQRGEAIEELQHAARLSPANDVRAKATLEKWQKAFGPETK